MSQIAINFQDAQKAFLHFLKTLDKDKIAGFLEEMASQIDAHQGCILYQQPPGSPTCLKRCITGELGRTLGQIRLFSALVAEGSLGESHH